MLAGAVLTCIALAMLCQSGNAFELSYEGVKNTLGDLGKQATEFVETNPTVKFEEGILTLKNNNGSLTTDFNPIINQTQKVGEKGLDYIKPLAKNVTQFIEENNSSISMNNLTEKVKTFGKELETIQLNNGSENVSAPIEEVTGIFKAKRLGT